MCAWPVLGETVGRPGWLGRDGRREEEQRLRLKSQFNILLPCWVMFKSRGHHTIPRCREHLVVHLTYLVLQPHWLLLLCPPHFDFQLGLLAFDASPVPASGVCLTLIL